MKKRMTLTFKSKKGNEYLYDDSTGLILPWSKEDEKILKQLLEGNKTEDILKDGDVHESKVHYLSYLLDQTGAFLEECDIRVKYPGEEEIVDFIGSNLARQLILSVTDDCNLRCKYCIYSDAYHLTKDKSCKYMTEETAKRAIDYFFELISPQLRRNPRKKIGITFYGGEPLMNMKTIKYAVRYINQFYKESNVVFPLPFLPLISTLLFPGIFTDNLFIIILLSSSYLKDIFSKTICPLLIFRYGRSFSTSIFSEKYCTSLFKEAIAGWILISDEANAWTGANSFGKYPEKAK